MSVSSTSRVAGPYTGNGSTTAFPFNFKVFQASDLQVIQTDLLGTETTMVLTTDYTVALNSNQDSSPGGTVNFNVAPPLNFLVTITSAIPSLQSVVLTQNGGFYPTVLNDVFDRFTILIQQCQQQINRAVLVNISSGINPATLLTSIANSVTNAAASAVAAATSATAAAASATAAAASAGSINISNLLQKTNNLSDLSNAGTARANLGAAASGANTDITSLNAPAIGAATATTQSSADNSGKVATTAMVQAALGGLSSFPAGSIIAYAGSSAPTGFLACPLAATNVSRTTYAALFAAIGTTWGAGDGSTTFGIPFFPADYTPIQANSNVGTSTTGANISHSHAPGSSTNFVNSSTGSNNISTSVGGSAGAFSYSTATAASGGSANLAAGSRVLHCIKY